VQKKLQTRGAAFGFMPKKFLPKTGRLGSVSHELPQGIVCGGDLPQLFIDGKKMGTKITWRPRNELSEGDKIQVLFTSVQQPPRASNHRKEFKIFVNRTEKVSVDVSDVDWLDEELVGIVDIAGSLRSASLVDGPEALAPLYGAPLQQSTESVVTESELEDKEDREDNEDKDGEGKEKEGGNRTPLPESEKEDEEPVKALRMSEYF